MNYDYSKLQQSEILNVIEMYFKTRELTIMKGTHIDTILLGNGIMFIVEDGILSYYGGLLKSQTHDLICLTTVMKKLQTAITLECPTFEQK